MKTYYNMIFGFVIFAAINSIMLLASLFVTPPAGAGDTWAISINSLIAAVPAGVLAFLLSHYMKTGTRRSALMQSAIWTAIQLLLFIVIAWGNQTLSLIFSAPGFYIMLAFVFAGPVVQWLIHSGFQKE